VEFEYDPVKSALNYSKHGIDFQTIQEMWKNKVVAASARQSMEDRMMAIGFLDSKFWTVIITLIPISPRKWILETRS
jgi:uncharacterized DUF497 family protein